MIRKLLFASLLLIGLSTVADAQTAFTTPGGSVANGNVEMCLNASGQAVPTSSGTCANAPAQSPITGNATGTTASVVGTLAAATGKTTYLCGFNVSAIGGTAAVGPITIAGLKGGSMVFQLASSASGNSISESFQTCLPASAADTAITTTTTADGTASAVSVNSYGYQQ
jgi:hypothetical protein